MPQLVLVDGDLIRVTLPQVFDQRLEGLVFALPLQARAGLALDLLVGFDATGVLAFDAEERVAALDPYRTHQLAGCGGEDRRDQLGINRLIAGMEMEAGLGVDGALAHAAVGEVGEGGARCDALFSSGWDAVERRCRSYRDAGADLVFVDGIRTADDLAEFANRLGDLPRMYNGELPPADVQALGFDIQIHRGPVFALYPIIKEMMVELRQTGAISAIERWGSGGALRLDIANALGLERITGLEQRYATAG
mgnify:CR=1 FL=1